MPVRRSAGRRSNIARCVCSNPLEEKCVYERKRERYMDEFMFGLSQLFTDWKYLKTGTEFSISSTNTVLILPRRSTLWLESVTMHCNDLRVIVLTFQIRETRTYARGFGLVSTIPHMMSGLVLPLSKSQLLLHRKTLWICQECARIFYKE